MTYRHSGWSLMAGGKTIKLSSYQATRDYTFYACFTESDVHAKATDEKYFSITNKGLLRTISGMTYKGKITIPTKIGTTTVTGIETGAFQKQQSLTGVFFLPDSQVVSFGGNSFQDCHGLRYIEYPATLTEIGEQALCNC